MRGGEAKIWGEGFLDHRLRAKGVGMDSKRTPVAGGFFVMVGMFAGFWFGAQAGWATFGTMIGVAAGLAVAAAIWLIDRRRSGS